MTSLPPDVSRTVPETTISCSGMPMPRNWTDRRLRCSGPPAYVLDDRRGGDPIACDDDGSPLELLAAVNHHREVQPDLGVEDRRPDRGRAVDHREHGGRDEIGISHPARRIEVEMHGIGLPHRARVLADLLPADRVEDGLIRLTDGARVDWHRSGSSRPYGCAAARQFTHRTSIAAARLQPGRPAPPPRRGLEGEVAVLRSHAREVCVAALAAVRLRIAAVEELHGVCDDAHRLALLLFVGFPLAPVQAPVDSHAAAAPHVAGNGLRPGPEYRDVEVVGLLRPLTGGVFAGGIDRDSQDAHARAGRQCAQLRVTRQAAHDDHPVDAERHIDLLALGAIPRRRPYARPATVLAA